MLINARMSIVALVLTSVAGSAGATSLTVDFGVLGASTTKGGIGTACSSKCVIPGAQEQYFTTGGVSIGAIGYNHSDAFSYVTQKPGSFATGGGETGLGESDTSGTPSDADYEVSSTSYLLIDNSSAITAGYQNATFSIGSIQSGEGANVYAYTGSLMSFSPAHLALLATLSGSNGTTQSLTIPDDQYIVVQATSGDVTVAEAVYTKTPTPEPGAVALLATGLLALGGARRWVRA